MYKKQMTLQKLLCFLAIIASVVIFLYSLGIMTDLYDTLYSTMWDPTDPTMTDVPGSIVYYDMQGFNGTFVKCGVALILLSCLLFITNTHIRRRYYIGNYVSLAAFVGANIGVAAFAHAKIEEFKAAFLQVDFEALLEFSELWDTPYTESTFWFDVHYGVFAFSLLVSLGLVLCAVWKIRLMKEEARLLTNGKEAAA